MFVKMLEREQLLQAGAVGVDWGGEGAARGLPGGSMGLDMGDDANCFCVSADKFGKVGQSLWMAVNLQVRMLGSIWKCLSRAGPLQGSSGWRSLETGEPLRIRG